MDDPLSPRHWRPDNFHDLSVAEWPLRRQSKRPRIRRSAEELRLARELLSQLTRDGSHASDWEPITDENALYGLRAGEHTRLYRQTRKGWEPIKALNGVRSEERVIALRRRHIPQRSRLIVDTGLSEAERRAHHRAIHDFFFHNQRLPTEPDPGPARLPRPRSGLRRRHAQPS